MKFTVLSESIFQINMDPEIAKEQIVLYGGSVNGKNAKDIFYPRKMLTERL
ncbi:MAG: hypothetical protein R3A12_17690 [Ignavibacteria bacterium]